MSEERLELVAIARDTLTVSSSVVTLDSTLLVDRMRKVIIQVDPAGGNIRMTLDGATDPEGATTGFRYDAGDIFSLERQEAVNARFIYDASTDATLQCLAKGSTR